MKLDCLGNIQFIVLGCCCVFISACANQQAMLVSEWRLAAKMADSKQHRFHRLCQVNLEQSDNIDQLIEEAQAATAKSLRRRNRSKNKIEQSLVQKRADIELSRQAWKVDARLQLLRATHLQVAAAAEQVAFTFDQFPPVVYQTNGQPSSSDGNINITLAAWEEGQFIIEKNGPGGRIIESWLPSSDLRFLYLTVLYAPTTLLQTVKINRLFECQAG